MKWKLDKKDLRSFLQGLIEKVDLYAPVKLSEGVFSYKKIEQAEEVDLTHPNPQKPVKDLFFPQSEVMFRYEKVGKEHQVVSAEGVKKERVVLGARPCDVQAISILDELFLGRDTIDEFYSQKRKATTIICLGCNQPRSTCFCSSMSGGPFIRTGSDLFLIDLGEAYGVECLSEKGKAFLGNKFLKEADGNDSKRAKELEEKATQKVNLSTPRPEGRGLLKVHPEPHAFTPSLKTGLRAPERVNSFLPIENIEKKLDPIIESPFWDRLHEKCVGCGVCTLLCPTCHCFDIVDEALNNRGQRVRNWDSCLFPLYSLETSGHNPRPTGRERTRQRIMHKFNYYPKIFNRIACVGCGRCVAYCPVNFDIRQAIKDIQDY